MDSMGGMGDVTLELLGPSEISAENGGLSQALPCQLQKKVHYPAKLELGLSDFGVTSSNTT